MNKSIDNIVQNFARGGGTFHNHRIEIVRNLVDGNFTKVGPLSTFSRDKLFKLRDEWTLFAFGPKDWQLCDRLLTCRSPEIETALLKFAIDYAISNLASVNRLYDFSSIIGQRLMSKAEVVVEPDSDVLPAIDFQSLFGIRVQCASNRASTSAMIEQLEKTLKHGWARARLINPLVYHASANPPATMLDSFLSYLVTGKEHDAEKLALKLMLSDEAAREASLAFKIYVGLAGHPYDAVEFIIDHIEYVVARGEAIPRHLENFLYQIAPLAPRSRGNAILSILDDVTPFISDPITDGLSLRFEIETSEVEQYAKFFKLKSEVTQPDDKSDRVFDILSNMRAQPYPNALQFQIITASRALWHFTDAGRLIGAMLRSIYMIERASRDLEARDVFRLLYMLGFANPFIASAPSAMFLLRNLAKRPAAFSITPREMEAQTAAAFEHHSPFVDRLWINQLQWTLRCLEEEGRVEQWLSTVRQNTKFRPSFLTGINWHWVEDVIATQRLKPFRSFDGAYLFVHMELETNSDPQRLRLTLEPLIRHLTFDAAVAKIIEEFGTASQAIVRRYFTTFNLLASGTAANYVSALDQRVRALEECILEFGFGPLLTEEVYESEVKTLTAELLLTDVNAGKFEVPWDTFHKDAAESHEDLFQAVTSLRTRFDETGRLTANVDVPVTFPNGRSQTFRIRSSDQPVFALLMTLVSGYMQHPAFGLEVILSGRFRHNNLMQELWAAMADVASARIPSVTQFIQSRLIEDYRSSAEQVVDQWCLTRLQTKRRGKDLGLFDLVPTAKDVAELVSSGQDMPTLAGVIEMVTDWIKRELRQQVSTARDIFLQEMSSSLRENFNTIKDHQLNLGEHRNQDIHKVHTAITDAVLRRVSILQNWFDGVDAVNGKSITLADLSNATEALFDNMIPGKQLKADLDDSASQITYEPNQVKIAFDLLREIYFNALSKGRGPIVELSVRGLDDGSHTYVFHNAAGPCSVEEVGEQKIAGQKYQGKNDAVKREGNSGRAKIAASSATIIGCDTFIVSSRTVDSYELVVRMAKPDGVNA